MAHGQLTPYRDTDWLQWAIGAFGLGATALVLVLGYRQIVVLRLPEDASGSPQGADGEKKPKNINVVAFEQAGSGKAAAALLEGWQDKGVTAVSASLQIDQWYVVAYVAALTLLNVQGCFWLHQSLGVPAVVAYLWGVSGGVCAIVAGGLDFTENLCLFGEIEACRYTYSDRGKDGNAAGVRRTLVARAEDMGSLPALAGRASRIKFGLSFVSALLALAPAFWQFGQFLHFFPLPQAAAAFADYGVVRGIVSGIISGYPLLLLPLVGRFFRKSPKSAPTGQA